MTLAFYSRLLKHFIRYLIYGLSIFSLCLIVINLSLSMGNFYINTSTSLPYGLYKATYFSQTNYHSIFSLNLNNQSSILQNLEFKANDLILICLDEPIASYALERQYIGCGKCPQNTAPLGKYIVALEQDLVTFKPENIEVNGKPISHTKVFLKDSAGRELLKNPLFNQTYRLNHDEFVVANQKLDSFDSRYFGVIKKHNIVAKLQPIWIFD